MKKRGQVALEFIMTYGWAILVVLAAIGALAYFGVLSPSKYLPEKCLFTTGIGCRDFILHQNPGATAVNVTFTIENNLGDTIIIPVNGVSVTYRGGTPVLCVSSTAGATQVSVANEATHGFSCANVISPSPGVGQSVKVSAAINYSTSQGFYNKTAVGDISGSVR